MMVPIIALGVCSAIVFSSLWRDSDLLSPARVFSFTWAVAIGLASLKLSALQHQWSQESWLLLLLGVGAFLCGTFVVYLLHLRAPLLPVQQMRVVLAHHKVDEKRLFALIVVSVLVYFVSYAVIYLVKGFLPIFVAGTRIARTEFYVFGFGVLINSTAFISFFSLLYWVYCKENRRKRLFVALLAVLSLGSYFLLLQRFQVIMAAVVCISFLYYATRSIRMRHVVIVGLTVTIFFFWISSLRVTQAFTTYMYNISKMKLPRDLALLTEPYMYFAMNLENFARTVDRLDHHTYGYFTFDFITALTGLKYWVVDYFSLDRTPYLISGYNTYSALWYFYRDFGVVGVAVIPFVLGFGIAMLYYEMRQRPTISKIVAYGIMLFVMIISFFHFPIAFLWFEYNLLMFYVFLRLSTSRQRELQQT
jgi:oligosaccharide repeat unit polymerase